MKGIVKAVSAKAWKDKTLYSFKIEDDWFGLGDNKPPFDKGDVIEFEYKTTDAGRKNVLRDTLNVVRQGTEVIKASTYNVAVGSRDDYWRKKEERDVVTQKIIQLQSSRNSAIALADVLLKNGAVKLPEAPAKRMDVLTALVGELTGIFESQSLAHRGMAEAESADPEDTTTEDEAKPDEGIWDA